MRKVKKPVFFIVLALILLFAASVFIGFSTYYGDMTTVYIKGAENIRFGIDIKGGVDVTFTPPEGVEATDANMDAAKEVLTKTLRSCLDGNTREWNAIKTKMKDALGDFIFAKTKRKPMILPIIMEI